jgi:UDP-N-acetyl-D-galactosamine dehydrogenase
VDINKIKVGVIGLGYVGLPLAIEFSSKRTVVGFDINLSRVKELRSGRDSTLEVSFKDLSDNSNLYFTSKTDDLKKCNCFIVTVPTPVTSNLQPDFKPLESASEMLSKIIKKDDLIIYESTVYPGATEEICVPILEKFSGLQFNKDFYVGYSPERINPGDKNHRLVDIIKVTSGSNPETARIVDSLYASIIKAGTFKASSIAVAEAAKVIENTQRDINIALINELAMIFDKLGLDSEEVLSAAGSKWNFLPFRPGLVGGHCIGVDPYYLTYRAQSVGYDPEIILAGRKINDGMGAYVVHRLVKEMCKRSINISSSTVLIMGFSFKENCPDTRNSKLVDVYRELIDYGINVDVFDPWVDKSQVLDVHNIKIIEKPKSDYYDAVILAVAHDVFINLGLDGIQEFLNENKVIYDLKNILPKKDSTLRL